MFESSQRTDFVSSFGIAPEVLSSTQNFEDCRNTLNDWLTVQHADNITIDFDDKNDMTLTLVTETADAFGDMAEAFVRRYGIEGARSVIAQAWCIDANERATMLNSLSGSDELIVQATEDFDTTVSTVVGKSVDANIIGSELAAEFVSVLHGTIAEYICLLEDQTVDELFEEGFVDVSLEDLVIYRSAVAAKSLHAVLRLMK